jgi:hypothetical protein
MLYNSVSFLSPSLSAIMIDSIMYSSSLPLRHPKTMIYRLSKKTTKFLCHYKNDSDVIFDVFDDMIDILSNFHLCHYNICLVIYLFLLCYVIYHQYKTGPSHKIYNHKNIYKRVTKG